jgi:hypothetical protein
MKGITLLFFSLLSLLLCTGQTVTPQDLNFKLEENKKVIWKKNYKHDSNKDSLSMMLESLLKNNLFTSKLNKTDDGFFGQSTKVFLSSTKSMAIGTRNPYCAHIKIDVMDGRYSVSVTDIVFDGVQFDYALIGKRPSDVAQMSLKDFVVKNKKFEFRKNNGAMSLLRVLNKDFNYYFTLKKAVNN